MQIMDPVVELHSTKLYTLLQAIDQEYAARITRFVREIAPILATTERYFPYYTRHDAHHGFRVVRRMEQVVTKTCLEVNSRDALASAEIFLLIAAAYAHDLGMTVFPGEAGSLLNILTIEQVLGWETNPTLQAHLRREHSKRGGEYIIQNAEQLGVPVNLVDALDTMMKAHNFTIAELDGLDVSFAAQERLLDVRQLAAIVCIGDALEFSDTRVMEGVLDRINVDGSDSARVSYRENMKHVCIGDSLAVDEDGRVVVAGTFQDETVLALAHHTLDQMEEWVQGYCDIDRRSKLRRLTVRPEPFLRNLKLTRGRFERLGVRLNKKNIIHLIASNAVWRTSAGIAVRELIQNAVEACRYRAHHSGPVDRYTPTVTVEFDRVNRKIKVVDNGCGMSERIVLNNFLTVGNSRSKEAGYVEAGYAPIARFGIGFWSVFTIAKNAYIETAAFEAHRGSPQTGLEALGTAFNVSLDELKDYTVFKAIRRACGTEVVLSLRDGVVIDDVIAQCREMLLCSEIPVTFVVDEKKNLVPQTVPDISETDLLAERHHLKDELGIRTFFWRGIRGETELSLGFVYRMCEGKATFLADQNSSLMTAIGGIRFPKTSVCGFSVPVRPAPFCIDLMRIGTFFANRRTPEGFEFGLDRQELLPNAASEQFAQDIAALVHDGYREFLIETNSRDNVTIAALREQAQLHGGNVYDVFTGEELLNAARNYPDLVSVRLFPVHSKIKFDEVSPVYFNLTELRKLNGLVFTLQQRMDLRIQGANFISFDTETPRALEMAYALVQKLVGSIDSLPVFLLQADRLGSMLFDADPESSVLFFTYEPFGTLCIQVLNLGRASFDKAPSNVLAPINGKWSGSIYLRTFDMRTGKPYVFLGRHRLLIERSSRLAGRIQELFSSGERLRLVEIITHLKEDQEGFTPEGIRSLLEP